MKQVTLSYLFAALATLLMVFGAHAQPTLVPPGCAQTVGPVLPWQDCQGAMWVKDAETIVQVLNVRGPGCVARELPAQNQTCLVTNERRTVWMMFEVQPQPNGPSYRGAPAGQLRFKIIPADVDHDSDLDDGQNLLGMTDFDFALFRVTDKADRADACAAIAAATSIGTPGTVQEACNYSGLPGPTGLGSLGTGLAVDDQRYNRPVDVRVGDVFLLAVDNFSLNATYFRLMFGGDDSAATTPAARVTPQDAPLTSAATLAVHKACGYGVELQYPSYIALDSIRTDAFLLNYRGRQIHPTAVRVEDVDGLRGQGTRLTLLFSQKLDTGMIILEQTGRLADRYGRQQLSFTRMKRLRAPVQLKVDATQICSGQAVKATTASHMGFGYGGWTTSAGLGAGVGVLGSFAMFNGAPSTPGIQRLTYHFTWPEGCEDSVSVDIWVKATPTTPVLTSSLNGAIEATVAPQAEVEWRLRDSVFAAPAYLAPPCAGSYRARQTVDGCTSTWSQPLATTITDVRRADGVKTSVFPNPATDVLNIRITGAQRGRVGVEMINAEGKTILEQAFADSTWDYQLPTKGLPAGMYTLLLTTPSSITSHRVVVR